MTISEHNYEAYMLDYLDGNLDPLLTAELMAFLAENPGYESLLSGYDRNYVLSCNENYSGKQLLKKDLSDLPEVNAANFDEFCIAASEGILKENDHVRLAAYISRNPEKQPDFDTYQKLRLKTDNTLVFTGKAELKKQVAGNHTIRFILYTLGIAASIALLLILFLPKQPDDAILTGNLTNSKISTAGSSRAPVAASVLPETAVKGAGIVVPDKSIKAEAVKTVEQMKVSEREIVTLQLLKPVSAASLNSLVALPLLQVSRIANEDLNSPATDLLAEVTTEQSEKFSDSSLGLLIKRLNFWKAAETAVSGFNYLTESQLSLGKKTDENGKLTGLWLDTESYSISGSKMK